MKVKKHCPECGFPFIYMNDACYCTDALGLKKVHEERVLEFMNEKWYNADNKKSLVQFRKHYASVRKEVQDIVKQQDPKKSLTTQNNSIE